VMLDLGGLAGGLFDIVGTRGLGKGADDVFNTIDELFDREFASVDLLESLLVLTLWFLLVELLRSLKFSMACFTLV